MNRRKNTKRKAAKRASTKRIGTFDALVPEIPRQETSQLPTLHPEDEIGRLLVPEVALSAALKRKVVILEMVASLHEKERDGLTELVNAGIDVREIILHLWTIWQACRPVPLVAIPDVPLKELRKLPKRLRRIAHLIDAIREHRLMPSLVHYSSRRALPPSLRLYARDLEKRLTAPQKRNAGNVEPGTKEKIGFIFYVRATTKDKEPHYKALAAVINAFNQLGDKRCGGNSKKVTEDSLKQLYQSHPDLRVAPPHLEMS